MNKIRNTPLPLNEISVVRVFFYVVKIQYFVIINVLTEEETI